MNALNKPKLLKFLAGATSLFFATCSCGAQQKNPNTIIIYADDLGYGDVQCYNPERGKIPTPHIDKLACQGMRIADGHSSSAVCTPSRYSILTGRYHWRTSLQRGVLNGFSRPLIALGRLTLAGLVREHGYATACIGKTVSCGMLIPIASFSNDTLFSGKKAIEPSDWMFHTTAIHAVGGLVLSGDKASLLKEKELAILKKLLKPTGKGARFSDAKMETAVTDMGYSQYYYFFNWSETDTLDLTVKLNTRAMLADFWTGEKLGEFDGNYTVSKLPPHSARLIETLLK